MLFRNSNNKSGNELNIKRREDSDNPLLAQLDYFDEMFNNLMHTSPWALAERVRDRLPNVSFQTGSAYPRFRAVENDNEIQIEADLPGVDENDLDVTIYPDRIKIQGRQEEESTEEDKDFFQVKRNYGAFVREIPFPCEVDQDKIKAKYKNGVLKISVPKSGEARKAGRKLSLQHE